MPDMPLAFNRVFSSALFKSPAVFRLGRPMLVGALEHVLFFHLSGIIIPTD
jgi:hypothetical protein